MINDFEYVHDDRWRAMKTNLVTTYLKKILLIKIIIVIRIHDEDNYSDEQDKEPDRDGIILLRLRI